MERTVLLRHELADGSWHYDWLLERPAGGAAGLVAFRVGERVDRGPGTWEAERIADHRTRYLDYEGPISGGRGSVRRVAAGACRLEEEGEAVLRVRLDLGELSGEVVGRPIGAGRWRFERR